MNTETAIEIEQFIRDYLTSHIETSRLDADFHEEFSNKFGGKRIWYPFGSCPNLLAMKWIKKLYKQGILKRYVVGLSGMETGFPKWIYSYQLVKR